jgi:hypothetical protein
MLVIIYNVNESNLAKCQAADLTLGSPQVKLIGGVETDT